ncbi:MAG: hypothetical protein ACI9YH_004144 [Colwellia sp.]|jgi:hypothetical protein
MPDDGLLSANRISRKDYPQFNITIQPEGFVSNRKAASLALSLKGSYALILLSGFRACDKANFKVTKVYFTFNT